MSHLLLDEIYSIEWKKVRLKKSFGTAIKFWGSSISANVLTYAQALILALVVWKDPGLVDSVESQLKQGKSVPQIARDEIRTLFR